MSKTVFYYQIMEAKARIEEVQKDYLRRFGWETFTSPGAYLMWRRDFKDLDAARMEFYQEHPGTSRPALYGVVTADVGLAVRITATSLDDQEEMADLADEE